jgi:acyl-CoA oxidase
MNKLLTTQISVGHSANYAVVLAQLYTKGKCYGIHPFIVQLRDEETHEPLSGIKIGEIGCKLGMNSTNNGYLGFDRVRIPRTNMLMKNSQVLSVSITRVDFLLE